MNVIFTCGGTAGHVNPALALAGLMKERDTAVNILFVGSILNVVLFQRRHPRFKRFPAPYEEVEPADSRKE